MKLIDDRMIERLSAGALASERLRLNHNLHPRLEDPVQRFCNAMEPGTYVRPHRHTAEDAWELFLVLRGAVAVVTFGGDGVVLERLTLSAHGPLYGVEIPAGAWHTLSPLEAGTVVFEVKRGPYRRLDDKDFAAWAPPEGDGACGEFARWFRNAATGSRPPEW